MTDTTQTIINQRPGYIQGYDEALLQRIMGKDDGSGNFTGGLTKTILICSIR